MKTQISLQKRFDLKRPRGREILPEKQREINQRLKERSDVIAENGNLFKEISTQNYAQKEHPA